MQNYEALAAKIDTLGKAEKVTKQLLGELSRELLEYIIVDESNDIATVNRLLSVLTPMNQKTAVLFFDTFLPFILDTDTNTFGKKTKGEKKVKEFVDASLAFLDTEDNNIWTWAALNVEIKAKPVDYAKKIEKDVYKALNNDENPLDPSEVLKAVLAGGLDVADIVDLMAAMAEEPIAEAA